MTIGKRASRQAGDRETDPSAVARELARLVPADVPPGLRSRVLATAAEARGGAALKPWMRLTAGAVAVLVAALLALDPLMNRREEARLAALLDGRSAEASRPETAPELAEAGLGPGTEAGRLVRLQDRAAAAANRLLEKASLEAVERLKGRWEYEASENPY